MDRHLKSLSSCSCLDSTISARWRRPLSVLLEATRCWTVCFNIEISVPSLSTWSSIAVTLVVISSSLATSRRIVRNRSHITGCTPSGGLDGKSLPSENHQRQYQSVQISLVGESPQAEIASWQRAQVPEYWGLCLPAPRSCPWKCLPWLSEHRVFNKSPVQVISGRKYGASNNIYGSRVYIWFDRCFIRNLCWSWCIQKRRNKYNSR